MFIEGEFETIFIDAHVKINGKVQSTIVGEIYRTPNSNEILSITRFEETLKSLPRNANVIIGTDQNFDLLKVGTNGKSEDLLNLFLSHNMIPLISRPTRITSHSATIIDNIYIRNKHIEFKSGIIITDLSDHLPIFGIINCNANYLTCDNCLEFTHRSFTDEAIFSICNAIDNTDWSTLNSIDLHEAYAYLITKLSSYLDIYAPEKLAQIPRKNLFKEKWMTKDLLKISRKKNRLYKSSINKPPNDPVRSQYNKAKREFNLSKRISKQKYYADLFNKVKNDSKKTWALINKLTNKRTSSISVDCINFNGEQVQDKQLISELFCDYFTNIGPEYARAIPPSKHRHQDYLNNHNASNSNSIFLSPTNSAEIVKLIINMKPKSSCGIDKLSSKILKLIAHSIANPLATLLNRSLVEGLVPDSLKVAKIIPLFKSKERTCIKNYRPISLLPAISKILEKIVHFRTYSFLQQYRILSDRQYGFRPGHSTVYAAVDFISDIMNNLNNHKSVLSVFLDLSKAFDTIDHDILLHKLEFYGIRGIALNWFKSYLGNRYHYVTLDNKSSTCKPIQCGVPQGSVLGPLLFIIYINDISSPLVNANTINFADDSTVSLAGSNINTLYTNMNNDLNRLTDWFQANKLSLNISKSHYMLFSRTKTDDTLKLLLCDKEIKRQKTVTFLGIQIDDNLDWKEQIFSCKHRLGSALYALNQVKFILPLKQRLSLYYTLAYPHLIYGVVLWGSSFQNYINQITTMQKKIIRAIANVGRHEHTNEYFLHYKLLKFEDIYKLETLKFMYRYVTNSLPCKLLSLFTFVNEIHHRGTRNNMRTLFRPQLCKLKMQENSLFNNGPRIWNDMMNNFGIPNSLYSLKNAYFKNSISNYSIQQGIAP